MPECTQEAFLATVRKAASFVHGEPVKLPEDTETARVIKPGNDVIDIFMQRLDEAKIRAHRVASETALPDKIVEILAEAGAKSALLPAEDTPGREAIIARLQEKGIALANPDERDAAFEADAGITGVTLAVAETASICLPSGGQHRRLASLAVPTHIGIVRVEQIVPDLLDFAARWPARAPANMVLVSAPSKTADIELALVMGVHGPRLEYVVVVG
ncbi:MAG TPA: LUD domain-containing protein [Phycisphaerae bacterium]|nr:LUD domain-containing protein [Phycisphaerae bacterium]HRY68509.1 LUD domain-containing protein [Phycisphaerae bacterium]HSA25557.1 LUD domain-containing protein [Phycisphaerae bacterium]